MTRFSRMLLFFFALFFVGSAFAPLTADAQYRGRRHRHHHRPHRPHGRYR